MRTNSRSVTFTHAGARITCESVWGEMHGWESGQAGRPTEVSFSPVVKRQSKEEREQRNIILLSPVHVLVCVLLPSFVYCQPHSKRRCSTEGTDARRRVAIGTKQKQRRTFSKCYLILSYPITVLSSHASHYVPQWSGEGLAVVKV